MTNEKSKRLFIKAIEFAGSQVKLAKQIGMTQQGVSYILNNSGTVPAHVAKRIDRYTGGAISKEALRPDLFT